MRNFKLQWSCFIQKRMYSMKKILPLLFVSCSLMTASLQAAKLGINYDPVHSIDFSHGVGLDDKKVMIDAIKNDFDALKKFREKHPLFADMKYLKTFFAQYGSAGQDRPM